MQIEGIATTTTHGIAGSAVIFCLIGLVSVLGREAGQLGRCKETICNRDSWFYTRLGRVTDKTAGETTEQLSLFDLTGENAASRARQERLEAAVEDLRKKYGNDSATLGCQDNADIGLRRGKRVTPGSPHPVPSSGPE